MTDEPDTTTALLDGIASVVQTACTTEALRSAHAAMDLTINTVERVAESDPDLQPEVTTVLGALAEIAGALGRAAEFAQVRHDVAMEKLRETWEVDK